MRLRYTFISQLVVQFIIFLVVFRLLQPHMRVVWLMLWALGAVPGGDVRLPRLGHG